jgi:hypothetical protein
MPVNVNSEFTTDELHSIVIMGEGDATKEMLIECRQQNNREKQ